MYQQTGSQSEVRWELSVRCQQGKAFPGLATAATHQPQNQPQRAASWETWEWGATAHVMKTRPELLKLLKLRGHGAVGQCRPVHRLVASSHGNEDFITLLSAAGRFERKAIFRAAFIWLHFFTRNFIVLIWIIDWKQCIWPSVCSLPLASCWNWLTDSTCLKLVMKEMLYIKSKKINWSLLEIHSSIHFQYRLIPEIRVTKVSGSLSQLS